MLIHCHGCCMIDHNALINLSFNVNLSKQSNAVYVSNEVNTVNNTWSSLDFLVVCHNIAWSQALKYWYFSLQMNNPIFYGCLSDCAYVFFWSLLEFSFTLPTLYYYYYLPVIWLKLFLISDHLVYPVFVFLPVSRTIYVLSLVLAIYSMSVHQSMSQCLVSWHFLAMLVWLIDFANFYIAVRHSGARS